jgi:arginase family enzyme
MPFRSLIQAGSLNPARFVELGLGRFANDEADLSWLRELGARLIYAHDIQLSGFDPQRELEFALGEGAGFLSIDLDGLDQSVAPGVSAPNPLGLSLWHAALLAERAGASQGLLHFDLMELNPTYDQDGRTARAAALIFLHFMAGFQRRAI